MGLYGATEHETDLLPDAMSYSPVIRVTIAVALTANDRFVGEGYLYFLSWTLGIFSGCCQSSNKEEVVHQLHLLEQDVGCCGTALSLNRRHHEGHWWLHPICLIGCKVHLLADPATSTRPGQNCFRYAPENIQMNPHAIWP